jgi:hypothetical protein
MLYHIIFGNTIVGNMLTILLNTIAYCLIHSFNCSYLIIFLCGKVPGREVYISTSCIIMAEVNTLKSYKYTFTSNFNNKNVHIKI